MRLNYTISPLPILLLLALLVLSGCPGAGGEARGEDPLAGVYRFEYSKIRVVQQYSNRDYVHLRLYLLHGPALADPTRAGLESLAVEGALTCGAGQRSGAQFAAQIESLGAQFGHYHTSEYSVLTLDCLPDKLREAWAVFSSALLEPQFDEGRFAAIKAARIARLEGEADQPDQEVERLARETAYAGHPEAIPSEGEAELIRSYTAAQAQRYFSRSLLKKCAMVLVTVGPVDGETIADMLYDNIDMLAEGDCEQAPVVPRGASPALVTQHVDDLPIQYVVGTLYSQPDQPLRMQLAPVLIQIVQARLDARFPTPNPFACQPQIRYLPTLQGHGRIQLSSPRALACTELVLSELRKLRQEGLTEEEWASLRPTLVNQMRMRRETAVGIADLLGTCLVSGDWENCGRETIWVQKLRVKKLNFLLSTQLGGISLAYIGDTTRMDRKTLSNF